MRTALAILIIALFVIHPLRRVGIWLHYEWNKAYIAAKLCENKDKPELKCDGKCYLRKQIQKEIQTEPPLPNALKEVNVFVPIFVQFPAQTPFQKANFNEPGRHLPYRMPCSVAHPDDVFHPPRG